jgi:hypothetical protein
LNINKSCIPKKKFNIIKIKSMEINKKSPHKNSYVIDEHGFNMSFYKKNSMVNNT